MESRDLFEILAREHLDSVRAFLMASLRDATATEPAWLGRVRLAWKQRLLGAQTREVLRPEAHAAAARLLGLRGPSTRARHEVLHAEERAVEAVL